MQLLQLEPLVLPVVVILLSIAITNSAMAWNQIIQNHLASTGYKCNYAFPVVTHVIGAMTLQSHTKSYDPTMTSTIRSNNTHNVCGKSCFFLRRWPFREKGALDNAHICCNLLRHQPLAMWMPLPRKTRERKSLSQVRRS